MSNGFIHVVDAHFMDKNEEEENILDPSACDVDLQYCMVFIDRYLIYISGIIVHYVIVRD